MNLQDLKEYVAKKTGYDTSSIDVRPPFQVLKYKDESMIMSFAATTTGERGSRASDYAMSVKGNLDAKYEKEKHTGNIRNGRGDIYLAEIEVKKYYDLNESDISGLHPA